MAVSSSDLRKGNCMTEKELTVPQVTEENIADTNTETTPSDAENEIIIPIKFNKEVKELTVSQAAQLAQKGLKYDLIWEDYERLKKLAKLSQKSVPEFLTWLEEENRNIKRKELYEKCGGDEALAEHIIELEEKNSDINTSSLAEVQQYFPEIKSKEDLPNEVVLSAELKGTLLLDEYLRYILAQKKHLEKIEKIQKNINSASIGSQSNRKNAVTPEAAEFLKGLWK